MLFLWTLTHFAGTPVDPSTLGCYSCGTCHTRLLLLWTLPHYSVSLEDPTTLYSITSGHCHMIEYCHWTVTLDRTPSRHYHTGHNISGCYKMRQSHQWTLPHCSVPPIYTATSAILYCCIREHITVNCKWRYRMVWPCGSVLWWYCTGWQCALEMLHSVTGSAGGTAVQCGGFTGPAVQCGGGL